MKKFNVKLIITFVLLFTLIVCFSVPAFASSDAKIDTYYTDALTNVTATASTTYDCSTNGHLMSTDAQGYQTCIVCGYDPAYYESQSSSNSFSLPFGSGFAIIGIIVGGLLLLPVLLLLLPVFLLLLPVLILLTPVFVIIGLAISAIFMSIA